MKITHLTVANFLGARAVDLAIATPVTLIAGKNGAGKSSIQEAIRHALGGESCRVSLKKDFKALITDGADGGYATVTTDATEFSVVLPSGKGPHHPDADLPLSALQCVTDPHRFAAWSANDRRTFLFNLMGVSTDGPSVGKRLKARGCDMAKADQIKPLLRAGFPEAAKEAQAKARDAKAAWKVTTGGDTWGKDKAGSWKAPVPDESYGIADIKLAEGLIAETDAEIEQVNQQIGEQRAAGRQRVEAEARAETLKPKVARLQSIRDKLARDESELAEWSAKLAELPPPGGAQPKLLGCPCCAAALQLMPDGSLAEYETAKHGPVDMEIEAKRKQQQDAVDLFARSVANDKRDLAEAERAAAELAAIEKTLAGLPAGLHVTLDVRLDNLKADRKARAATLHDMFEANKTLQAAVAKTRQAAEHHADVLAWLLIADAFAPDGIPAELLAEALSPINDNLAHAAGESEWARVEITADMEIRQALHERPYALLSESEKWRADAMIAAAIAEISGLRILMLDRFDVLDGKGREDAIYWLDGLAQDGAIDTALIFGTLKALPAGLPESIGAAWIEGGVAGEIREAA